MKVMIKPFWGRKKWLPTSINRKTMTAGLARRREVPTLSSTVKVSDERGHSHRVELAKLHDENRKPVGNSLLQEAIAKRKAIADRQIKMNKEMSVVVALRIELLVKAKKRSLAQPGSDIDVILTVDCLEDGPKTHRSWTKYRSIMTDGEFKNWELRKAQWRSCKKPPFLNQKSIDDAVEEFMASLGGA